MWADVYCARVSVMPGGMVLASVARRGCASLCSRVRMEKSRDGANMCPTRTPSSEGSVWEGKWIDHVSCKKVSSCENALSS